MHPLPRAIFLLLAMALLHGCAVRPVPPPREPRPLWLVSNGFHSAIGMRSRDAGPELRALAPDAPWLLVGWGNSGFFLGRESGLGAMLRHGLLPERSVLHVVPVERPFAERFAHSDVIALRVEADGLAAALREIGGALARDARGQAIRVAPGYFPDSVFYRGREWFWFPKTCNTWTARVLARAGIPARSPTSFAASELVWRVEKYGHRQSRRHAPLDGF